MRSGNVQLTFIGDSVSFTDALGQSMPLFAPEQVTVQGSTGHLYIDVPFGTTSSLDASSINGDEFTISGATASAPVAVSGQQGTFRYTITGTGLASGQQVTLTFVAGHWTYTGQASVVQAAAQLTLTGDTYIDVQYASSSTVPLDLGSITDSAPELTLGGSVGTAQLDASQTPTILGDGLVRYYVSGQFAPGIVSVFVHRRLVAGHRGRPGSRRLGLVQAHRPGPEPGLRLDRGARVLHRAVGRHEPPGRRPLRRHAGRAAAQDHRCDVELTIGTDPVTHDTHIELTASGTITVIKIGNIASGAADFVLQTGSSLSDIEFYGVAAIQTNFDFLQQYGIYLSGMALIEINATSSDKQVTLSLAGVPGDGLFEVPNGSYSSTISSLPTDTFDKVALPQSWISLFANPTSGGASTPTSLLLDSGQTVNFASGFTGVTLANAKVEGVVAGSEWKILNGDGSQYFIQTELDQNGNQILVVSGEKRTYDLQPLSFELEVVGGATLYDPSTIPGGSNSTCTVGHGPEGLRDRVDPHGRRLPAQDHRVPDDDVLHRRRQHRPARAFRPDDRPADDQLRHAVVLDAGLRGRRPLGDVLAPDRRRRPAVRIG